MMTPTRQQRGSTLLVALIMLVLLTLLALSAIESTTTSVQMVGNAQFREEAVAAAQRAVETVVSNNDFMSIPPQPIPIDVNGDLINDFTVTIAPQPTCISYKPVVLGDPGVPGMCAADAKLGAVCYWTVWDVRAMIIDTQTGASVVLHQGVNALTGLNDAVAACS